MSHETFELIGRLRETKRRAAMATLVRTAGATPRKEGTKMFVGEDGSIFGSVTIGGCVDGRVIERAAEVLASGVPERLTTSLGDGEAWEIGLTCGGAVEVFIEPLTETVLEVYEAARQEWAAGRTVSIVTALSGAAPGARTLLGQDGGVLSADPAFPIELLVERCGEGLFTEVLRPPVQLVIFGASAVAIPLVTFARMLGFRTVVIDGRSRFATRERFPDVDELQLGIVSELARQRALGPSTPVVLVTHDYKIEIPVLKRALASSAPYIGLLGNRRRGAAILQVLREDGIDEAQLARIRVPIGLDLGGETASEIALCIIAEIAAVMHGRNAGPMSTRTPVADRMLQER
jgi:xanthine dehydrogenase accessory factor